MSAKLDKVIKEIEKMKNRVMASQTALNDLENQRDELEKLDLVHTLRALRMKPADLKQFVQDIKNQVNIATPTETENKAQPEIVVHPEIVYREEAEDEE